MNMYINILSVGSDRCVKGGISAVINQILTNKWSDYNIQMEHIPTYIQAGPVRKLLYFVRAYIKIRKYLKKVSPDVVHIHMSQGGSFIRKYLIHRLCKKNGIKNMIHLHGSSFMDYFQKASPGIRIRIKKLFTECSGVIVLGEEWRKRIRQIAPQANITILRNAVPIPKETADVSTPDIKILYLGLLIQRKGVIDLLQAVNELRDEAYFRQHKLKVIIGGSGEQEASLKAFADTNDLLPYVKFTGWVSGEEKSEYLRSCQVFVLPSYNEGLPISILEAMSYGLPIIATKVGSINEAVEDGRNGFLVNCGDVKSLKAALKKICTEAEVRKMMAAESRKLAVTEFSSDKYCRRLADIYINL